MEAGRIFFWAVAGVSLLSALLVVTVQNVVRAAVWLMLTLFTVAIFYVFLSADFLAAVQVLVYIGGIIVMILFTVMFTRRSGEESYAAPSKGLLTFAGAALFCGGLFAYLYRGLRQATFQVRSEPAVGSTLRRIGDSLLTRHVVAFEVVSILLLMALVGAVILIKKEVKEESADAAR